MKNYNSYQQVIVSLFTLYFHYKVNNNQQKNQVTGASMICKLVVPSMRLSLFFTMTIDLLAFPFEIIAIVLLKGDGKLNDAYFLLSEAFHLRPTSSIS
jgi:hypothetical protein